MKTHELTTIPADCRITVLPARHARGSDTWRLKGGMMGGSTGSCAGVTGGNGIGIIPRAFRGPDPQPCWPNGTFA